MATSRVKTWVSGDNLTAADLNAEFNNLLSAAIDLNGAQLTFDQDGDTYLKTSTDDRLDFYFQSTDLIRIDGSVNAPVNGMDITLKATTVDPTLTARGADTNIGINVIGKGTGMLESDGGFVLGSHRQESFYGR
jgi:hypothetical protein